MRNSRVLGFAVIAALASATFAQVAGTDLKPKAQAKVYEATLQGMIGQSLNKVVSAIDDWKFEALAAWEAVDPTAKEVAKHNRNKIKFSKKEYAEIFGGGGNYKVVVYNKLVGTEQTKLGEIDASGMSASKDVSITLEKYTVIRTVFKDNVLAFVRVWPVMDQAGMSGGMTYRR